MLTILQDRVIVDGTQIELASAEGVEVMLPERATCKLAAVLIEQGHSKDEPVRIVRADPFLFGPPHKIEGVTLGTTAAVDFFAEVGRTTSEELAALQLSDKGYKS